jgi:hypothetical protein
MPVCVLIPICVLACPLPVYWEFAWFGTNIYTLSKSKDEDKDDGKEYLHIGEKVDMEGAEKWCQPGERILGMKKKRREHWKKNIAKRRNHPKLKHTTKP